MGERVIWIRGYVPRAMPKTQVPYAEIDFPVSVEDVDPSEVSPVAVVTMPDARRHGGHDMTIEIIEYAGKLWRPVIYKKYYDDETRTAEEALARSVDNPVAVAANRHRRQVVEAHAVAGSENPALAVELAYEIAKAAEQVCIVDGVAYRECHEPTWIVTPAKFMSRGIILQPYLGIPGLARDTAWFSYDRLAEAEAFAEEIAAGRETEVVRYGEIAFTKISAPEFDDVVFAEDRLLKAFTKDIRILAGNLPEEVSDMAEETRRTTKSDRPAAVDAAFEIASALARIEGDPGVETLLSSARVSVSQVDFFRRNAVFGFGDDEALTSIHF